MCFLLLSFSFCLFVVVCLFFVCLFIFYFIFFFLFVCLFVFCFVVVVVVVVSSDFFNFCSHKNSIIWNRCVF